MTTMTGNRKAWLWRAAKHVTTLLVLLAVGYVFYDSLKRLDAEQIQWQPKWLLVSGVAYALSMAISMLYWWWSMVALGQSPRGLDVARAYYIGHLGKYVPGKALVVILRAGLVQSLTCRPGMAALTVVYETITLMAAGALWFLAVLCWTGLWPELPLWATVAIIAAVCLPTVPIVFNYLIKKIVTPFRHADAAALPKMDVRFLFLGIVFGLSAWLLMGMSLAAAVWAVNDSVPVWSGLVLLTAQFAAATIVGWILPTPGGLGGREWMLMQLLLRTLEVGPAALVPLLLRLTWVVTELVISGLLYPLPWLLPKRESSTTSL